MEVVTKPKDFIINMALESGGKVISNFLLHGLSVDCQVLWTHINAES